MVQINKENPLQSKILSIQGNLYTVTLHIVNVFIRLVLLLPSSWIPIMPPRLRTEYSEQ